MAQKSIAPENRGREEISQDHLHEGKQNHSDQDRDEKDGFDFGEDIIDRIDKFHR